MGTKKVTEMTKKATKVGDVGLIAEDLYHMYLEYIMDQKNYDDEQDKLTERSEILEAKMGVLDTEMIAVNKEMDVLDLELDAFHARLEAGLAESREKIEGFILNNFK